MKNLFNGNGKRVVAIALVAVLIIGAIIAAVLGIKKTVGSGEESVEQPLINVTNKSWDELRNEGLVVLKDKAIVSVKTYVTGVLTVDDSVEAIADNSFNSCVNLNGVKLGDGIKSIGSSAFYNCSSLEGELVIPESVTSIGDYAFYGCTKLASVTLPESLEKIGNRAFMFCSGLKGEIKIPDSVTAIEDSTFYGCFGITKVTLGDEVKTIGHFVFYENAALKEITIPETVRAIGKSAFSGCTSLEKINFDGSESIWKEIEFGKDWNANAGSFAVNYGSDKSENKNESTDVSTETVTDESIA